nr:MAG TPA: hypothetical protein [Bacteriophage sp.]
MSHLNQQISSCFQVILNTSLHSSHLLRRYLIIKKLLHTKIYSYRM